MHFERYIAECEDDAQSYTIVRADLINKSYWIYGLEDSTGDSVQKGKSFQETELKRCIPERHPGVPASASRFTVRKWVHLKDDGPCQRGRDPRQRRLKIRSRKPKNRQEWMYILEDEYGRPFDSGRPFAESELVLCSPCNQMSRKNDSHDGDTELPSYSEVDHLLRSSESRRHGGRS